jgi:hypothetical protein
MPTTLPHPGGGAHLLACSILDGGAHHQPAGKMRPTRRRRSMGGGVDSREEAVVELAARGYGNEGGEN